MKFEPFKLERWLSEARFKCDIDLSASVITKLKYNELINENDLDLPVRIGPTNGVGPLREQISKLYSGYVEKEGILITHGAAEANFLLLNHLMNPGDECVFVVPNYMQVYGILKTMKAKVKLFHLREKNDYKPDIEEFKELISRKIKAIIITNPNNPIGSRFTNDELQTICNIAEDTNAYVIIDEVLSGLEIDGVKTTSPVEMYDKGISTRSVSKLGLSGLRVGWIASRDNTIAKKCWAIKDYTSLGNSYFNQQIALAALKKMDKINERNRKILRDRVKILMKLMKENNEFIYCKEPEAGSTALVKYRLDIDSETFCRKLAEQASVAVSPGEHFEAKRGFRLLYATETIKLREGLERIVQFTKGLAIP